MTLQNKPWWWPQPINDEWRAGIRADYPEETEGWSDDEIDDYYSGGCRYPNTWDHLGDARDEHEGLADAFLALVEEVGRRPEDFI